MKTHVAVYDIHEKAIKAIEVLNAKHYPMEKVSMVEKEDIVDDHIKIRSLENIKLITILLFILIGMTLGVLASTKILIFPGFHFLEDTNPIIGGFIGFNIGLLLGAVIAIVVSIIMKKDNLFQTRKHIEEVKYLIVIDGTFEDIQKAEHLLKTEGVHNQRLVCNYCTARNLSMAN